MCIGSCALVAHRLLRKVFVVNKVEKRFIELHTRYKEIEDVEWKEV